MEIWKQIEGFEGLYEISSYGRVKTLRSSPKLKSGDFLSNSIECAIRNGKGYKTVTLYKNKVGKQLMVHRLVAKAFIPNPNNKPQVNHKDADKHNNNVDNLEWVTNLENKEHSVLNGLSGKGEKNSMAKLTSKDVKYMRYLYSIGIKPAILAKKYNICKQHLHSIVKFKSWVNI